MRNVDAVHVVAEHQAARLLQRQDEPVGQQHLIEMVARVKRAEQQRLEQQAEGDGERHRQQDGEEQISGELGQREGEIGPQHVEAAMGQIDDAQDAEDQRQPARHQEE